MLERYYCLVDGTRGPKRPHATLDIAKGEATRLWLANDGERTVFILQAIDVLPSEERNRKPKAKVPADAQS